MVRTAQPKIAAFDPAGPRSRVRTLKHLPEFDLDRPPDRIAIGRLIEQRRGAGGIADLLPIVEQVRHRDAEPAALQPALPREQARAGDEGAQVDRGERGETKPVRAGATGDL